jgi:hypothetical protein
MFFKTNEEIKVAQELKGMSADTVTRSQVVLEKVDTSLSRKKEMTFKDLQDFFNECSDEISTMQDIVFRISVLDTAAASAVGLTSSKVANILSSIKQDNNYLLYLVSTRAMELNDWIFNQGLNDQVRKEIKTYPYLDRIVWMDINDRTQSQNEFWIEVYKKIEVFKH